MARWLNVPIPNSPETEDAIRRYIGCEVKFRRRGTTVIGNLKEINQDWIQIANLKPIMLDRYDLLLWDEQGPQPQEPFSDEEKALAEKLYEFRAKEAVGPRWKDLTEDTKDSYRKIASDVLDWIDTRKCASCRDKTCSLCGRVGCPHDCQNRGGAC
jgi:hypothetical protein